MRVENIEDSEITPTHITLHQASKILEVGFANGDLYKFPCEYLRVYSPSAEVRGHSPDQAVLQTGKENVNIDKVEPVGQYAVKLFFSDGHNTGLFSWKYLHALGAHQEKYWNAYLAALEKTGYERQPI